jgi:two-component system response regulator DevR
MIRVALLDDHLAVVSGLRRVLADRRDIEVLATAADEVTLARELRGRRPDILIVGYDPARGDALSLCRRVKSRPGAPRVLLYTAYAGAALTIAARVAQADGLLGTRESAGSVIEAIRRIAGGTTVMPKVSRRAFEAAVARLDDRDLPVFSMLLDGAPVPEIAEGLLTDERRAARRVQELLARICSSDELGEAQGSMRPRRMA